MAIRTQGAKANKSGNTAEEVIATVLRGYGVKFEQQKRIGVSIYGHEMRADFYLPDLDLIIESKWQDTPGSADEKLPYLVANIRERYPYPAMLVLGGIGWKRGAKEWVRQQVDDKLIGVMTIEQFMKWAGRL
jgi:hypothetical protein